MSFPCNVWFQFQLAIMIRQLGHRYWPCFHPCITRVDIKPQTDDRLTSCKFISEFIDGTDYHPAMFTLSIRAWLSPPELPYVRSLYQNTKPVVVHMDVRKLKRDPDPNLPSFSK